MAEAESTEPESSDLRNPNNVEDQTDEKSPVSPDESKVPDDQNETGERTVQSSASIDSTSHVRKSVFGSTTFGTTPAGPGPGSGGSSVLPSSSFGATGHGAWQPSYRPPTVFGGSASSQGNPFAGITSMKQPGVSRSGATVTSQPSEALIAPGRLNTAAFTRKNISSDTESDDDRNQRPVSSSILAPPRIVVGGDNRENPLAPPRFALRPSVLAEKADTPSSGNPLLKPATLKAPTDKNTEAEEPSTSDEKSESQPVSRDADDKPKPDSSNNGVLSSEDSSCPLDSTDTARERLDTNNADHNVESSSDGFVFGQNLSERVAVNGINSSAITSSTPLFGVSNNGNAVGGAVAANSGDGFVFGQNLADRVINADKSETSESAEVPETPSSTTVDKTSPEKTALSLEESAREYQAKHDTRTELDEVEVVTGEEEESNVLQINCKLFVFDKDTQTWIERGRGQLRVNDIAPIDTDVFHSRLVMRTQGSYRLILNTKIWAGMTVERASSKSVRVTASDGEEGIKVFLISATPKDSENILSAIDWRVQRLQVLQEKKESPGKTNKPAEKRKADSLEQQTFSKKQKHGRDKCEAQNVRDNREESNDSSLSLGDPETEASNGSHCSSLTGKSEDD